MSKKAYLKATREKLGISHDVLAAMFNMQKRTIQRLEAPNSKFEPYEDIIERMELLEDDFDERILEIVEKLTKENSEDKPIQLTYWKSQQQINEYGLSKADYRQVNALNRAIENVLMYLGYVVEWSYPTDEDNKMYKERQKLQRQATERANSGLGESLI